MTRLALAPAVLLGLLALPALAVPAVAEAASPPPPVLLLAPGSGEVRALVVGIDQYRNVNPLRGAVADARDIETALRRMGSKDVTTLIDEGANRTELLRELDGLVARSRKGDLVIITLAGHGAREDERLKGSSENGSDEVFLMAGFDPRSGPGGTEKILNHEFHHYIKQLEYRGAQVIFVADTCYGGGLAREIVPGSGQMTYRQVVYRLAQDDLKPVSTPADASLTNLDFDHTTFLAAVDSETKAPEVKINGVFRGALSYAFARAVEGAADEKRDGMITGSELFAYARKVVYQWSDERQTIVTEQPNRDLDREIVLRLGDRSVAHPDTGPQVLAMATPAPLPPVPAPIRLASMTSRPEVFAALRPLLTRFEIVDAEAAPDVVWNPVTHEALAGGDKIALGVGLEDLPGVIDRTAAVRDIKSLVAKAPQSVTVLPDASLHRRGARIEVEVDSAAGRHLVLVDITGVGTVQMLYPRSKASPPLTSAGFRVPFMVRDPFGADEVLAITSQQPMDTLVEALMELDNRRTAGRVVDVLARFGPKDARIGLVGLFTVP